MWHQYLSFPSASTCFRRISVPETCREKPPLPTLSAFSQVLPCFVRSDVFGLPLFSKCFPLAISLPVRIVCESIWPRRCRTGGDPLVYGCAAAAAVFSPSLLFFLLLLRVSRLRTAARCATWGPAEPDRGQPGILSAGLPADVWVRARVHA